MLSRGKDERFSTPFPASIHDPTTAESIVLTVRQPAVIMRSDSMDIGPGTRLGAYEVISRLGEGGMGEVYQARDVRLGREVALKMVHPRFGNSPEHLDRFRREAQVLASLSHPHIAAVHQLEEIDGLSFFVMELVQGETLQERLSRGLTVPEVLRISVQVAAALEAAHEKGVVHRDLKPANIKITSEGVVKVLDFGLAKALAGQDSPSGLSQSPTLRTADGVILGTAAYMSPEQARGRPVDRRADIWSFGCVLFEMLTLRRPFIGETVSDTIASVLEHEPNWTLLPAATPPGIQRLLRRCLEKDLHRRLRDIGDARLEVEEALAGPSSSVEVAGVKVARRRRPGIVQTATILAIGGIVGAVIGASLRAPPRVSRQAAHFVVSLPQGERLAGLDFPATSISPDGSLVVYVAAHGGRPQLLVRAMNSVDATPIPGTADAISPFFSPDSRWIGFFAGGKLKKVSATGGVAVTVCDAPIGFGGTWGEGETIVFAAATGSGLSRVDAAGGTPTRATTLDTKKGEFSHRWPEMLPDGETVLFTVGTLGSWDDAQIVAQSLTSGQRHLLIQGGTNPHYLPTGHLLYARGGAVMAVPFDAARLKVTGTPVRVLENVLQSHDGAMQLSVSRSGTLVYVAGRFESAERQLVAVDRSGAVTPFAAPARAYSAPRASPDGQKLVVTIAGTTEDVWVYNITQGTLNQLTFEANNAFPVWTPDGQKVTFSSNRTGPHNLFWTRADATAAEERLLSSDKIQAPGSWSPDGRLLAFVERHATTGRDIWMLPAAGGTPYPFLNTAVDESSPRFSPEGRWVAYVSNESGRAEIYVRTIGGPPRTQQVSSEGGVEPVWAPSGRGLFYRSGEQLMTVSLGAGAEEASGRARGLFKGTFEPGTLDLSNYDIMPDGQRFVMVRAIERDSTRELRLVLNWLDSLVSAVSRR